MSPRRLDALGRRIERLVVDPESISAPFTRLFRPILYRVGWRPSASATQAQELIAAFNAGNTDHTGTSGNTMDLEFLAEQLDAAIDELEKNIKQAERATVVNRRPLVAHAAWLRRLYELVVHGHRAIEHDQSRLQRLLVTGTDSAALLPPLSLSAAVDDDDGDDDEQQRQDNERGYEVDSSRLLEMQLDAIDEVLATAREEDTLLARRRRLLEAARQLLLETSAALPLEHDGVHQRLRAIARHVTQINRMEAVGVRGDVSLLHQARMALSRGERDRMFAALQALDQSARARRDGETVEITTAALTAAMGSGATADDVADAQHKSAGEVFGDNVVTAIESGYRRGRNLKHAATNDAEYDNYMTEVIADYFAPGTERAAMAAALAVDGCVNVGGVLSPVRVDEEYRVRTLVRFPTQDMTLMPANRPADLPNAIIRDPRSVLLDLASGRLLSRRFVREEIRTRQRTVMAGEIRIYVLDGSTSMMGPRARMRDGILTAELATLMRRLNNPHRNMRTVLYYRYFTNVLRTLHRVATGEDAVIAIHDVASNPRTGGTDIQRALLDSLERVADARRDDPDLARAQIVLITDGEATVSRDRVVAALADIGELRVGISVIALGEENSALRAIVAEQRGRGMAAFYHFIPDSQLEDIVEGDIDDNLPVHLPEVSWKDWKGRATPTALRNAMGPVLDELAMLQRTRDKNGLRRPAAEGEDIELDQGQRAHLEASYGNTRSLQRRFTRWFPEPVKVEAGSHADMPEQGTLESDDLESVVVVLATICEVVELVDSSEQARKADAIELLQRLLPNARLSPARYDAIMTSYPGAVANVLQAVHDAARFGAWRHLEGGP